MNRAEVELRTLRSQMRRMQARQSVAGLASKNVSFVARLQDDAFEKQILADGQTQQIEDQLKTIEALEKRIMDGGGNDAQEVIRLTEELEASKKKQKKMQLENSVQVAKKDAMIANLQSNVNEGKA